MPFFAPVVTINLEYRLCILQGTVFFFRVSYFYYRSLCIHHNAIGTDIITLISRTIHCIGIDHVISFAAQAARNGCAV